MKYPTIDQKFNTVLSKNTFYFYNKDFEEYYEGHISSIAQNIFLLKNKIDQQGLRESTFLSHITEIEDGLDAVLTITGFSCNFCWFCRWNWVVCEERRFEANGGILRLCFYLS